MAIRNQFFLPPGANVTQFNAGSVLLRIAGPRLDAEVHPPANLVQLLTASGQPLPRPEAGMALIDTGASITVVDESALQRMGVQPVGVTNVLTPSGQAQQLLYPAELVFSGTSLPRNVFASVIGSPHLAQQGLLALVGRDVLTTGILIYNGAAGMFSLAF